MSAEFAVGLALGLGVYLLSTAAPFLAPRPSLEERLRQFDVDARVTERRGTAWTVRPLVRWAPIDAVLRPLVEDLAAPLRRMFGGQGALGAELERQLRLLQPGADPRLFLGRQVLFGLAAALTAVSLLLEIGAFSPVAVLLSVAAGLTGFVLPRLRLSAQARRRRARIVAELPAICRLLSLALDAGLTLDRALIVVSERAAGPLGRALQAAHREVVGDRRLTDALGDLAARERVVELDGFVTVLCVSDREGLELIPTLEAMATSLNEKQAARTIEAAEKGSIKMLAPVAFIMFPVALGVALAPLVGTVQSLLGQP
jgi:tight adherence protein C